MKELDPDHRLEAWIRVSLRPLVSSVVACYLMENVFALASLLPSMMRWVVYLLKRR